MALVHRNSQSETRPYNVCFSGDPNGAAAAAIETPSFWSEKVRKPYTITKSRESWSEMEHDKFLEALHLFDRDWKKIKAFVGSKSVIQIRSHAQKYFMKIQKNGTSEHVPPPRPKRKAAHPYPHKAPKKVASQTSEPSSSAALLDSKFAAGPQAMSVPRNVISSKRLYPLISMAPTASASPVSKDDCALSGGSMNWSSNSNDSAPHIWDETNSQCKEKLIGKRANYIKKDRISYLPEELLDKCFNVFAFATSSIFICIIVCLSYAFINFVTFVAAAALPDFAQVYRFIGSLFDPSARDHLAELKKMDTIDIETVLMLMNNLSVNLVSPELENHRKLISSYSGDAHSDYTGSETSS